VYFSYLFPRLSEGGRGSTLSPPGIQPYLMTKVQHTYFTTPHIYWKCVMKLFSYPCYHVQNTKKLLQCIYRLFGVFSHRSVLRCRHSSNIVYCVALHTEQEYTCMFVKVGGDNIDNRWILINKCQLIVQLHCF